MTIILTLGVSGTGPYGEINNHRAMIKDYAQHLNNMEQGAERKTKKAVKMYEDGIKERKAQIKEILAQIKKEKAEKKEKSSAKN